MGEESEREERVRDRERDGERERERGERDILCNTYASIEHAYKLDHQSESERYLYYFAVCLRHTISELSSPQLLQEM